MKSKLIKFFIPLLLIITIYTTSFAMPQGININIENMNIEKKEKNLFNNNYDITDINNDEKYDLKQEITELSKKTTYLLLGEANSNNDSSENYYKRHKEYLELRYNPEIPKDDNSYTEFDVNSQEYMDDILSGISVPGMFLQLNELGVKYSSYGEIRVSIISDELIVSSITLKDITIKEQDNIDPTKYNRVNKNLTLYYYFKKLDNQYKLLYLYGETEDVIEDYIEKTDEKSGVLSNGSDYSSQLEELYDFSKLRNVSDGTINKIHEDNKAKIVFLNSTYNMGTVASSNGFFINDGLIVTTYNYIEKSLMKAQNIIISNSSGDVYQLDGVVTMNSEFDIAILKVKDENKNYIEIKEENQLEKEDAIITINSQFGVGLKSYKGIITAIDKNIQTSIPITEELQGSPIFDTNGNLVGIINSKSVNTSISYATSYSILKQYYDIFSKLKFNEIKSVPFQEIKENYYIKYGEEKAIDSIPEEKLKEFSNLEDAKELIKLPLIKTSYKDEIISLRFKNDIAKYMNSMQFAHQYIENLKGKGYKETSTSNSRVIYENKNNRIIIIKEFDYLIIVMVKL